MPILETDFEAPLTDASLRVRYKLLDAWRGLAALAVVVLHSGVPLLGGPLKNLSDTSWGLLRYGALGVQLFFVISGYCIAGAAVQHLIDFGDPWPFIRARLRRIWPGYLASVALALLAMLLHNGLVGAGLIASIERFATTGAELTNPKWLIAHLTLTQVPLGTKMLVGLYWTLCYEVAFYGIVALLLLPLWRLSWRGVLGMIHSVTIGTLILLIIKPEWRFFPLDLWPLFGLGALLYDLTRHPRSRGVQLTALATVGLILGFVSMRSWGGEGLVLTSRVQFAAALGFAVLLWLLRPSDTALARLPLFRLLGRVGVFSYSLYLAHIPLRSLFLGTLAKLGLASAQSFWLVPTLFVPLALLFGWLFHLAFERPWIKNKLPRWMYARS